MWNLHDIGGVGEKAECQPQGITSHSIASWPGCNDAKLCTDLFGIMFSSSLLVFSLDLMYCSIMMWPDSGVPEARRPAGFDSWVTAPTTITASFSAHLPTQTLDQSSIKPSIKPSSNPVFPVVVECCAGLDCSPVVGRRYLPARVATCQTGSARTYQACLTLSLYM